MSYHPGDRVEGTVVRVEATVACGWCGNRFTVELDPARCTDQTIFDEVVYEVDANATSVQGGYLLCERCTAALDLDGRIPEDRRATAEEVPLVLADVERKSST